MSAELRVPDPLLPEYEDQPVTDSEITFLAPDRTRIWIIALIATAVISFFLLSRLATSSFLLDPIRDTLQVQQNRVTAMAATSTALSVALSALPGDLASPIATQLADLSGYFVVILAAIFLQKMLFGFVGYVAFKFIIPIACGIGLFAVLRRSEIARTLAIKLAIFGLAIFLAVPISIGVSNTMNRIQEQVMGLEYAYDDAAIEQTINELPAADNDYDDAAASEAEQEAGLLRRAWAAITGAATAVGETFTGIVASTQDAIDNAVQAFNNFIERIAWFIITTLVIPILTIGLVAWVIKLLFGFDIKPAMKARGMQAKTRSAVTRAGAGFSRLTHSAQRTPGSE